MAAKPRQRPSPYRTARGYWRESRRRLLSTADRHGLAPSLGLPRTAPPLPFCVVGVYRSANADLVERLVDPCLSYGAQAALWALDAEAAALAGYTVGCGPGNRFDLLNKTIDLADPDPAAAMVIVDDDVVLPAGIPRLVSLSERARLGLAMPAHLSYSHYSHRLTRRRLGSAVRLTTYVEIGPVLVLAPSWRSHVLPFPSGCGMGWGAELAWMPLREQGCLFGIVDAAPVLHLGAPGRAYDRSAEMERLVGVLRRAGVPDEGPIRSQVDAIQREIATWSRMRTEPPW